jgi:hypothetical protein
MMSARPCEVVRVAGRPRSHGSQGGSRLGGVRDSRASNALRGPSPIPGWDYQLGQSHVFPNS